MPAHREHDPEAVAKARTLYVEGAPLAAIVRQTKLSEGALYYWLAGGPSLGADRLPPIPLRSEASAPPAARPRRHRRALLVTRLWRAAELQVIDIEARLTEAGGDAASLERDAKTLGLLARTLRELVALESEAKRGAKAGHADEETKAPASLDAFRRELAAKLAQLGGRGQGA